MAGSVNKVILIGHLGADPESRNFPNGGKVVSFRMATSETWRDKQSGERKERTEWHSVSIFNENVAKVAEQYLKKGSKVYVEGQLETRKWQDQSGADRYTTEVVLRAFGGTLVLLDGKPDGGRDDSDGGYSAPPKAQAGSGYGAGGRPGDDVGRDEIPWAPETRG